jgi:homoserine kinase
MIATLDQAIGRAFCSAANLGAGFDVFGLALDKYYDTVTARLTRGRKIRIFLRGSSVDSVPREVAKNSAGPPAVALLKSAGSKRGLEITIEKAVPQNLGLGSSGATAAACTKVLDHLLDLNLSNDELVRVASLGEKAVTGTAHADNVAASLLGGFVIVRGIPPRVVAVRPPRSLSAVVVSPQISLKEAKTRLARKLVPKNLEVRKAVLNIGHASTTAAGFALGNIDMIGSGMEDQIAEPYREGLIPGYREVKGAGLSAGAAGVSISGAGPSIIALLDGSHHDPRQVARSMVRAFAGKNVRSTFFIARPGPAARVLPRR